MVKNVRSFGSFIGGKPNFVNVCKKIYPKIACFPWIKI